MEKNAIQNALMALKKSINNSNLSVNVANVLTKLVEILGVFYATKKEEIDNSIEYDPMKHRQVHLESQMTDYIVSINDAIKGKNDAFCIANIIYKEINYDEKKGIFKRKRLI